MPNSALFCLLSLRHQRPTQSPCERKIKAQGASTRLRSTDALTGSLSEQGVMITRMSATIHFISSLKAQTVFCSMLPNTVSHYFVFFALFPPLSFRITIETSLCVQNQLTSAMPMPPSFTGQGDVGHNTVQYTTGAPRMLRQIRNVRANATSFTCAIGLSCHCISR
jgi:hypothetical protein